MTELINFNELIECVHNEDQIDPRIQVSHSYLVI